MLYNFIDPSTYEYYDYFRKVFGEQTKVDSLVCDQNIAIRFLEEEWFNSKITKKEIYDTYEVAFKNLNIYEITPGQCTSSLLTPSHRVQFERSLEKGVFTIRIFENHFTERLWYEGNTEIKFEIFKLLFSKMKNEFVIYLVFSLFDEEVLKPNNLTF